MRRERFGLAVLLMCCICGATVCASLTACKDTGGGSGGGGSAKGGFRLSLSKREIPVANRAPR